MYPIPANATRIRYLESTGTQYVDTGIAYDSTIVFDADFAKTDNTNNGGVFFGILWASGNSSTIRRWAVQYSQSQNKCIAMFYTTTRLAHPTTLPSGRFSIDATATDLTIDGTTATATSSTFDPTVDVSIYIFARHTYAPELDPNPVTGLHSARLYDCQIYKSGILVRSFVPVRVGQTGYLFDRVSGQLFGNAGTGDFVLGPDTFSQGVVPTRMMPMGVRKRPYDALVEYVESTGAQYVDTGIVPTNHAGFNVRAFTMPTGTANNRLIGCQDQTTRFLFACSPATSTNTFFGWNAAIAPLGNLQNVTVSASLNFLNDRRAILNGETVASDLGELETLTSPIYVFGHCVNGTALTSQLFVGRLFFAQISFGATLVRDFIPVRVGTEGFLYDRANPTGGPSGNGLYGSATSTPLVAGPDKIPS